jgi:hypothetical protein
MKRYGDAVGGDVDPLDQEPQDACLLGRVELVPNRLERAEGFDHLALFQHGMIRPTILPAHRGDRPRDQLRRREEPSNLPEHQSLHLAGRYRAHWAGVVAPAARPEADVVAIQPTAPARVRPFGFLRPWSEVPALFGSAPPATPPSTGTGVVTFLMG